MPAPGPGHPAPSGDGHVLLLHRSEPERLARLVTWVRRGLERGEKVVHLEGAAAADLSVVATLPAFGLDVSAAAAEGRFEVMAPTAFFAEPVREALLGRVLDEGYPALRISGQATTALSVLSRDEHRRVEEEIDLLCRTHPVSALCQYRRPPVRGDALRDVVSVHPAGVQELSFGSTRRGRQLTLHGAVDIANVEVLRAVLAAAMAAGDTADAAPLQVDLAGVDHVGAVACRAILQDSAPFRAAGRRLRLVSVHPVVARVLRACGMDAAGIDIVESAP